MSSIADVASTFAWISELRPGAFSEVDAVVNLRTEAGSCYVTAAHGTVTIHPREARRAPDAELGLSERSLASVLRNLRAERDPFMGIEPGDLRIAGDENALRRLFFAPATEYQRTEAVRYEQLSSTLLDPRFQFMNVGWAEPEEEEPSWLRAEDRPWRYPIQLVRNVLAGVALDGRRVLDVGAGRGGTCSYLRRYTGASAVVGLDLDARSVRQCTMAYRALGVRFFVGDAQAMPFGERSFDVLVNIDSAHAYADKRRFFAEAHRVLADGGTFAFADFCIGDDPHTITTELERVGFVCERSADLSAGVTLALERNKATLEQTMRSLDDIGDSAREVIATYLELVNGRLAASFARGESRFRVRRLRKA